MSTNTNPPLTFIKERQRLSLKVLLSILFIVSGSLLIIFLYIEELNKLINIIGIYGPLALFTIGLLLLFPFRNIFVDPEDYIKNKNKEQLIYKFRLRGLLFNNLSVAMLSFIVIIIIVGFYFIIDPPSDTTNNNILASVVQVAISTLIIFLVHILFRVFKYLIRVAAFYNAKADSMEYNSFDPINDLTALSNIFTPTGYDISDLPLPSFNPLNSINPPNTTSTGGKVELKPGTEA